MCLDVCRYVVHVDTLCMHVKAEVDVVGLPQFLTTLYLEAWFLSLNLELSSAGPSGSRTLLSLPPQHWDYTWMSCCLAFFMGVLRIKCRSSSLQSKSFPNPPFYFLVRKCIFLLCPWVLLWVELYPSKRYVEAFSLGICECHLIWKPEPSKSNQVKSWEATLTQCDQCSCMKWERRQHQTKERQGLATRWQTAGMPKGLLSRTSEEAQLWHLTFLPNLCFKPHRLLLC